MRKCQFTLIASLPAVLQNPASGVTVIVDFFSSWANSNQIGQKTSFEIAISRRTSDARSKKETALNDRANGPLLLEHRQSCYRSRRSAPTRRKRRTCAILRAVEGRIDLILGSALNADRDDVRQKSSVRP